MTFVNDDQVEEIRGELAVDILVFLGAGHGLVEAEINLEGLIDGAVGDFGHRLAEWLEIVRLSLIGQDIAIDQEKDALFGARRLA